MFGSIKAYLYAGVVLVFSILVGMLKYLNFQNKQKDVEINTLNENIEQEKVKQKDEIKHTSFKAKQESEVKVVNDDSATDKIEEDLRKSSPVKPPSKEDKKDEEINSNFVSVTI